MPTWCILDCPLSTLSSFPVPVIIHTHHSESCCSSLPCHIVCSYCIHPHYRIYSPWSHSSLYLSQSHFMLILSSVVLSSASSHFHQCPHPIPLSFMLALLLSLASRIMSTIKLNHIPLLESTLNFLEWKRFIIQILQAKGYWTHIEGTDGAYDIFPKSLEPTACTAALKADKKAAFKEWWQEDMRA